MKDIVDDASLADGGVVVASDVLDHAADLVGAVDAADSAVHARAESGDPILRRPPQAIEIEGVDRAVLILQH